MHALMCLFFFLGVSLKHAAERESSNQVVTQIWECVSTMVRIGYPDILLEIWVSKEAQWVVRNLVKNMHS